jgi:hypothetical protein
LLFVRAIVPFGTGMPFELLSRSSYCDDRRLKKYRSENEGKHSKWAFVFVLFGTLFYS